MIDTAYYTTSALKSLRRTGAAIALFMTFSCLVSMYAGYKAVPESLIISGIHLVISLTVFCKFNLPIWLNVFDCHMELTDRKQRKELFSR